MITIAGGTALLIAQFAEVPTWVIAVAAALFVVGCVVAIVAAVVDARRQEKTVLGALWDGFKTAFTWLFWFLP